MAKEVVSVAKDEETGLTVRFVREWTFTNPLLDIAIHFCNNPDCADCGGVLNLITMDPDNGPES